jgi:hypothetical protein
VFDIVEKLSKFLLEIMTLLTSANKMSSNNVFIVGGRSFIYMKKSKDHKLTLGNAMFTVPHSGENFSNYFISVFYSLFVR